MKRKRKRELMRGEVEGRCTCDNPRRGKGAWRRNCANCKRWLGPAYYPQWWGHDHPRVLFPERVVCK